MAKQSYSIKGTNIANGDAVGNQIEQTVSVDDNILPAPQELAEYQKIDPKIVDFLINRRSVNNSTVTNKMRKS